MLRTDEIYDALDDDAAFAALPSRLAQAFEARSCLVHWRHHDGAAAVLSHSGHFSDGQLQRYASEFASLDPWAAAAGRLQRANSAILLHQIVPANEYEASRFYNEYVRQMGDDTFHCMGVRISNGSGEGMIALQRGRTQKAFEREGVEALSGHLPQLRRMLTIRGQLAAAERRGRRLASALDCFADAMLIVGPQGRVIEANAAAEGMLQAGTVLRSRGGRLCATAVAAQRELEAALAEVTARGGGKATALRLDPATCATLAPLVSPETVRLVLVTITRPTRDASLPERLRIIHGLSAGEAEIAAWLGEGASVEEIALRRGSSPGTVRNQVKAVMARMECRRQSEVAALVAALPRLRQQRSA